ncbi:MAG: thioredoxin domain-containing protein [Deltaproteobacteria bacterium]|nr:thioredoxin domain-containing protein [Deltaproteobacteria bacterium]
MKRASFLVVALLAAPAAAEVPECRALTGGAKSVADHLLTTEHPYDCCDGTIADCLKRSPACPLASRLAAFVCRRAASGQDRDTIHRAIERRAVSMMPGTKRHAFDLAAIPSAGSPAAKVKLVVFLCPRCPVCSKLGPDLYREVTTGRLAGKVTLHCRVFPVKSHPGSAEAGRAIAAAARIGKFWEFMLHAFREFDRYSPDALPGWAAAVGIERAAFDAAVADPATQAALVEAKKEGIRAGVEATPALFIDGRRWHGDMDVETLVDVLEEAGVAP